jgi:RNA polymerase sigma factor FliA
MTNGEMQTVATNLVPKIKKIARGICSRLPASISADDLAQAGIVGMMTALRTFDASRNDCIESYLLRRVRGAILDELRALDPLSRDQRKDARAISRAARSLEGQLGRPASEDEIAGHTGMNVDRVRAVQGMAGATTPVALETVFDLRDQGSVDPIENLAVGELREELAEAIGELNERERTIVSLYYVEELSLKEIGSLLGVTESRICQLHGAAVKKLRAALSR